MSSKTMLAYQFVPTEPNPVAQTVPVPSPAEDEVLVKVLAAGVCHSDVGALTPGHGLNSFVPPTTFTMGHEGAGIITELGSSVASKHPELKVGGYVAIWGGRPCREASCPSCSRGLDNLCSKGGFHGLGANGTWASYIAMRATSLVPVPGTPETVPPAVVSAATDAVLSPYHAMKTCCGVQAKDVVLCMGIGGLGLNAVSIAKRCLGARCVIACDVRPGALEDALAAGADHAVLPDQLLSFLAEKNLVLDFAFDFVGKQSTYDMCFAAIRPGGTIHVIGLGDNTLTYIPLLVMTKDLVLRSSFWGSKSDLSEVLKAIADGLLKPKVLTRPMSECVQVLDEMREGKLQARISLVPASA